MLYKLTYRAKGGKTASVLFFASNDAEAIRVVRFSALSAAVPKRVLDQLEGEPEEVELFFTGITAPHAFFGLKNLPPPEKPEKRLLTLFIHEGLGPC